MGMIMKIVNQREIAEDLLKDVFLKIRKNLLSYDQHKSRLFTWLLNIARNTAIDIFEKKPANNKLLIFFLQDKSLDCKTIAIHLILILLALRDFSQSLL